MSRARDVMRRLVRPLDPWLAREGERARRRLDPYRSDVLLLDAAPSAQRQPRWGYGRPPHPRLLELLSAHREGYRAELESFLAYRDDLSKIPMEPTSSEDSLAWLNAWLPAMDIISLYSYVRSLTPRRYVEVGSGNSTMVAHLARLDGDGQTEITSIDPRPRREIDRFCDRVMRSPLELADLGLFGELEAGDVVFLDGSHRVFTASDMTVFYLEVLPQLPAGVLVGIHDILWPDDYLPEWQDYWFSEQYLFGAYLLAGAPWISTKLASNYVSGQPDLHGILSPYWDALPGVDHRGFAFWFTVSEDPYSAG